MRFPDADGSGPTSGRRVRSIPTRGARARGERRKGLVVRKDGHVHVIHYPARAERQALAELGRSAIDPVELIALAAFLGHDPRLLDLDGAA